MTGRFAGLRPVRFERARQTRSATELERDGTTQARSDAARLRDEAADRRDREAEVRDALADEQAQNLDAAAVRRAAARDRAAARRDRIQAAEDRRLAAEELMREGVDDLTGALRRGVGLAAVERELRRSARTGEQVVIAFIDVIGLKAVNDNRGHAAGDALLRLVVQQVRIGLRSYDVVLRFGGDEFVCSLTGQSLDGARRRFEQISAAIVAAHHRGGISVGLAEATGGAGLAELITQADEAMLASRRDHLRARPV